MQTKIKQRLIGLLILLAILAIFFPLLFHNSHPTATQTKVSVTIPPKPKMTMLAVSTETPTSEKASITLSTSANIRETMPTHQKSSPHATIEKPAMSTLKHQTARSEQAQKKTTVMVSAEQRAFKNLMREPTAWVVHVGTFNNVRNVNRLITKLRKKGFDAYTRPILDAKGNRLLRVYVGPEIRKENAMDLLNKLQTSFHLKGVIQKYKVRV